MILNPSVSGGGGGVETCTGTIVAMAKFPAETTYYDGEQIRTKKDITSQTTITVQKNCLVYVSYYGAGGLYVSGEADYEGGTTGVAQFMLYARGDFTVSSA